MKATHTAILLIAALTALITQRSQGQTADAPHTATVTAVPGHNDTITVDHTPAATADSTVWNITTGRFEAFDLWLEKDNTFNPDPTRAVWMAALCPGLGQAYNRRYWKLPIVVGAYLGLGYATSWNNSMLNDYQRAYRDIMDNDPATNSYMNFFPPTTNENDLDKKWLTSLLKSRKDYYRRNRDLCIIGMAGVYLLAMLDAYVDASLSHFDITPDLTMDLNPAFIPDTRNTLPAIGLSWAINF